MGVLSFHPATVTYSHVLYSPPRHGDDLIVTPFAQVSWELAASCTGLAWKGLP